MSDETIPLPINTRLAREILGLAGTTPNEVRDLAATLRAMNGVVGEWCPSDDREWLVAFNTRPEGVELLGITRVNGTAPKLLIWDTEADVHVLEA